MTDNAIDAEGVADVFNRRLDRAITNYHLPHVAKLSWIYALPVGKGQLVGLNGVTDKLLGGWQLSAIHNWRAGNPISIGTGGITLPTGSSTRPDLVLGQDIVLDSAAPINFGGIAGGKTYLNRNAFTNPPVFAGGQNIVQRIGTVGPYLPNIRDKHFISLDMNASKTFKFDEVRNLEFRATFTNAFNWAGRGSLITNITNPLFGQFTGQQYGPRNVELALRFTF
jgi:hypothetical protein